MVGKFAKVVSEFGSTPPRRLILDALGIALVILIAGLIYRGQVVQSRLATQGKQAHDYLCYQKTVGVPRQIRASQAKIQAKLDYIIAVQTGVRKAIPGITITDIQNGIQADQDDIDRFKSTLKALARVHC